MSALKSISAWWRDRHGNRLDAPKKPQRGRWSLWKVPIEDAIRLREVASASAKLEELMRHAGWQEVLDAKAFYQANAQRRAMAGTDDPHQDRARMLASQEHQTLEGFFVELSLRIKRGQEAREQLRKLGEAEEMR